MTREISPSSPESWPLRFLAGLLSAPIQWFTALRSLAARSRAKKAGLLEHGKVRVLGSRMFANNVGDQLIREKIATLTGRLDALGADDPALPGLREDLGREYYRLGDTGLDAMVPMFTTEKEHPEAQAARDDYRKAEAWSQDLAGCVWPSTPLGWLGLVVSYALVAAALATAFQTALAPAPAGMRVIGKEAN